MQKTVKRIIASIIAMIAVIAVIGTSVPVEAAAKAPKKMTLKATSTTVDIKGKATVSVKSVSPSNASKSVSWKSSNTKVATISSKGVVTGKKAGKVTITATSKQNKKVKKTIKITVKNLKATAITLSKESLELKEGDAETLKATVKAPAGFYNEGVKWESSDVAVATVDDKGTVTAVKAGTATITVMDKSSAKKAVATVTVTAKEEPKPEEPFNPETATAEEVAAIVDGTDTATVLVDARPQEAYTGWALQGAANGGHLKNAILYSARWLDFKVSKESKREKSLTNYNKAIELSAEKSYIVYDYAGTNDAAKSVAAYFNKQGVKNVKVFDAKDMIDAGSLVSNKNYDRYLPSEIVKSISDNKVYGDDLSDEAKEALGQDNTDNVVMIDVSYGNVHESNYLSRGHVPGAVHMNTNTYERPRSYTPEKREKYATEYSLIPLDEFRDAVCTEYGITKDSIVIAFSDDGRPIGRLGFMLRSLGVKYYGMSGLYNAWIYNNYPLDKTVTKPTSVKEFGTDTIANPKELYWMDDVKAILEANNYESDNHSAGTIEGSANYSTYSYNDLMGMIPGTFSAKEGVGIFENADGTVPMTELFEKYYAANNIPTDKPIVHFCGDGWGAARDAYNAQAADMENVKAWGEGWVVWANRGNWFIDKSGKKVRYDKYLDEVVDENGEIATTAENMKPE